MSDLTWILTTQKKLLKIFGSATVAFIVTNFKKTKLPEKLYFALRITKQHLILVEEKNGLKRELRCDFTTCLVWKNTAPFPEQDLTSFKTKIQHILSVAKNPAITVLEESAQ